MITAERLEELIKQGGIVGDIDEHIAIKLDPDIHTIFYPWDGSSECLYEKDLTLGKSVFKCDIYNLEEISKKDFDEITWYNKTHAEHTERFEPPMWEDIKRFYGFSFYGNVIDELYHREEYRFFVDKLAAITVVDISKKQPFRDVYSAYATKENYEKACEMVRDLFNKGGAK